MGYPKTLSCYPVVPLTTINFYLNGTIFISLLEFELGVWVLVMIFRDRNDAGELFCNESVREYLDQDWLQRRVIIYDVIAGCSVQ